MTEQLYLLHHAPAPRRPHEIVGVMDRRLGAYGRRIAQIYAERIRGLLEAGTLQNVTTIVTNSLQRSMETAEIVAVVNNLAIHLDDRLRAQNFGILEGKTFAEIRSDPALVVHMWDHIAPEERTEHRVPNAESNGDLIRRVTAARAELMSSWGPSPLVITHGSVIDVIISIHENARLDAVEGANRRFEGRVIQDLQNGCMALGKPGEQFAHIPGTEEAISSGNIEMLKQILRVYLDGQSIGEEERTHISKLLAFI